MWRATALALVAAGLGVVGHGTGAGSAAEARAGLVVSPVTSAEEVLGSWLPVELFGKVVPSPPGGPGAPDELDLYPSYRAGEGPTYEAGNGQDAVGGSFTIDGQGGLTKTDDGTTGYGCEHPTRYCDVPNDKAFAQAARLELTGDLRLVLVAENGTQLGVYRRLLDPVRPPASHSVTSVRQLVGHWNPVSVHNQPATEPPEFDQGDDLTFGTRTLVVGDGCVVAQASYQLGEHGRFRVGPFDTGDESCAAEPQLPVRVALGETGHMSIDAAGRLVLDDGLRGYETAVYERANLHSRGLDPHGLRLVTRVGQLAGGWSPVRELGITVQHHGLGALTFGGQSITFGEGCGNDHGAFRLSSLGRFRAHDVDEATCEQAQRGNATVLLETTSAAIDEHGLLRLFDDDGAEVGAYRRLGP